MTSNSVEIDGKPVQVGDRIRFTGEGVVKFAHLDGPRVEMEGYAGSWWINSGHKIDILEKAKPAEPKGEYVIVEGTLGMYQDKFRYVKIGTGQWKLLTTMTSDNIRTWDWLLKNYKNGEALKILTPTEQVQ